MKLRRVVQQVGRDRFVGRGRRRFAVGLNGRRVCITRRQSVSSIKFSISFPHCICRRHSLYDRCGSEKGEETLFGDYI